MFGSNLAGIHGAGAAKQAMRFGAEYGQAEGFQGSTYAIPTKDENLKTLPLKRIEQKVNNFIRWAILYPRLTFLVTEIGCGLAGYKPRDIAPLFVDAVKVNNIYLPKRFWSELNNQGVDF